MFQADREPRKCCFRFQLFMLTFSDCLVPLFVSKSGKDWAVVELELSLVLVCWKPERGRERVQQQCGKSCFKLEVLFDGREFY